MPRKATATAPAIDPSALLALLQGAGIDVSALAQADNDNAPAKRGKDGYEPDAARRGGNPTGKMLYALNAAGLLTLRPQKGSPLTFGACFDRIGKIKGGR